MRFAEFRVYVQVDEPQDKTLSRMRDFIRTCIETLDGVSAVEVEPPRGSVRDENHLKVVATDTLTH